MPRWTLKNVAQRWPSPDPRLSWGGFLLLAVLVSALSALIDLAMFRDSASPLASTLFSIAFIRDLLGRLAVFLLVLAGASALRYRRTRRTGSMRGL
jgi:hypothetical protein